MSVRILDIPTTSIYDVKRSPMEAFQKADREAADVYVFNREKVAGVMLTQQQYESLTLRLLMKWTGGSDHCINLNGRSIRKKITITSTVAKRHS